MILTILYILVGAAVLALGIVAGAPVAYRATVNWQLGARQRFSARARVGYLGVFRFRAEFGARLEEELHVDSKVELRVFGRVHGKRAGTAPARTGRAARSRKDTPKPPGGGVPEKRAPATLTQRFARLLTWPAKASRFLGRALPVVVHTWRLLGRLWRVVRPDTSRMAGRFGFDDPFATSQLYAFLLTLGIPARFSTWNMQPSFAGAANDGEFFVEGSFRIAVVLYICMGYLVQRPVRRELIRLWRSRRRGRVSGKRNRSENHRGSLSPGEAW